MLRPVVETERDPLAYVSFPREHCKRLRPTNPPEQLHGEIKRHWRTVGILPNKAAITQLMSATMAERNDELAVQRAEHFTLDRPPASGHSEIFRLPSAAT